ncbi:MAG: aminoacyl-tRNA deacylase [Phormidesmis sp.]
MKTNAARVLDTLGIAYDLLTYSVDLDDLSAIAVARKLMLPADQVFKTLVVRGDSPMDRLSHRADASGALQAVILAVIPGSFQLDLKALARLSGHRKVETVPLRQVQPLTGYIRGGVTAIACKKPYPVFLDEWAEVYDHIAVSAGLRGQMLWLSVSDYIRATAATIGQISCEVETAA